jgi:membrane protease YdiL (CAAX protease family)
MNKFTWLFLALAFGISWSISELGFHFLPEGNSAYLLIATAFMFGPAIAAFITTRFFMRQPLTTLGPLFAWNRYVLFAALVPIGFAFAHVLAATAIPGLSIQFNADAVIDNVVSLLPIEQQQAAVTKMKALGDMLPWLMIAQVIVAGLLAGITINAIAAFGEELGWRGFLFNNLNKMGFWQHSLFVGVFWGLWHAPLILRGHNYKSDTLLGVLMMVLFCIMLSPLFTYFRAKANAVLAPTWLHGVMNATGGTAVFFSGPELLRGPAGLAGILVLTLANAMLYLHLRKMPVVLYKDPLKTI